MAHRYIVAGVSPRSEGDGERDDECGGFNDGMDDEVEARVRKSSACYNFWVSRVNSLLLTNQVINVN